VRHLNTPGIGPLSIREREIMMLVAPAMSKCADQSASRHHRRFGQAASAKHLRQAPGRISWTRSTRRFKAATCHPRCWPHPGKPAPRHGRDAHPAKAVHRLEADPRGPVPGAYLSAAWRPTTIDA
jgi:hypothetical protein